MTEKIKKREKYDSYPCPYCNKHEGIEYREQEISFQADEIHLPVQCKCCNHSWKEIYYFFGICYEKGK